MCKGLTATFKRELVGYFQTPVAYVFIALFLLVSGSFTFYLGHFFERDKADLTPFFDWHPWLFLFLIPAIAMRLWAEEKRTGTIEMLITLPVPLWEIVVGKFLAAWAFTGITLFFTFPIWLTVNYLGSPDNGVIFGSYIGSLLMAGGFLSIGSLFSALTRNQVIAFVVSAAVCFAFTVTGFPMVINFFSGWLPQPVVETISLFSVLGQFQDIERGIFEMRTLLYFVSLIVFFLFATLVALEGGKK
ncbi:MAG: ABC transporter permease subunit [Rickettsiales bacterium]